MADVEADSAFSLIGMTNILRRVTVDEAYACSKYVVNLLLQRLGYTDDSNEAVKEQPPAGRQDFRKFQRYQDLIGETPLVNITSLADAVPGVVVLGKCEFLNPGFSMKDRIVANIFDEAKASGKLKDGGTVVAASSGNTGAAVAMIASMRGYKAVITTSPKCSQEKIATIEAYGATVHVSAAGLADNDAGSYMDMAKTMARDNGWFDVDQYDNQDNVEAHFKTMGPEIWEQTDGRVTHFVAGGSTGGTITGTSKFLKLKNPAIKCILADPKGSVFAGWIKSEGREVIVGERFHVEGVGKGSIPGCMDIKFIDDVIEVTDVQAFSRCHELAKREGLLVGGSAGLNVEAAIRFANSAKAPAVIVTVLCDLGVKYLSKVYNKEWLALNNLKLTA